MDLKVGKINTNKISVQTCTYIRSVKQCGVTAVSLGIEEFREISKYLKTNGYSSAVIQA